MDDDDIQPLVRRFYLSRRFAPAWTHLSGPTADARAFLKELERAREHGLDPEAYDLSQLEEMARKASAPLDARERPVAIAALDIELTRNFLKYAAHRYGGQVNPRQLPAEWHVRLRQRDLVEVLERATGEHRVREELDALDPGSPAYAQLLDALEALREAEKKGGWPVVPEGGAPMKRGERSERVAALQRRLAASGDLDPRHRTGRFDGNTEQAVRAFEARHGLLADGVIGEDDLRQLNVPLSERMRQVVLNLERHRWVPDSLFAGRYLEVNVPEYALRVFENGRPVLGMRVVVGKSLSPTPLFADEITYLVMNPYWNVPPSIATEEILAELRRDPDYLARNRMRILEHPGDDAREVDPRRVNWDAMTAEEFRYAIRQDPGPWNAVGSVKFMCPNQFNVYLHDTPATKLFAATERDFSHGCIRLERPLDLAEYVMRGKPGWDRERLAAAFDTSFNRSVTLPEPLPVRILYWTAFVDDHGRLHFRDDVYGLDKLLEKVLRAPRPGISTAVRAARNADSGHPRNPERARSRDNADRNLAAQSR